MPRIYGLNGVAPEVLAYGMAKYSRSNAPLDASLREISQEAAGSFFEKFYHKYGHASIADMAHIPLAIEDVSLLAAMDIVDEPLWDGQERSTRYQNFSQSTWHNPLQGSESEQAFDDIMRTLLGSYLHNCQEIHSLMQEKWPQPEGMPDGQYETTIAARTFDIARYLLPLAVHTSLGQITSARTLEKQISRLLKSPYWEINHIASDMREAVTSAFAPGGPLAPTLVKYASVNTFQLDSQVLLKQIYESIPEFTRLIPDVSSSVCLHVPQDPTVHMVTSLFYSVSNLSYSQIKAVVKGMSTSDRTFVLHRIFQSRSKHHEWLRAMQSAPLVFDIMTDVGAFRDLNRHRKVSKVIQPLDGSLGYEFPTPLAELGYGAYQHIRTYLADGIPSLIARAAKVYGWSSAHTDYLQPLALRRRALFQMDFAEAAYICELRSKPAGHFSYREIVWQMHRELRLRYPDLASYIQITRPQDGDFFKR